MFSLAQPPIFTRLRAARRVLVAGAGGGFDVYAGLPLAFALAGEGKEVHLANLSFADLSDCDEWLAPDVAVVGPETRGPATYFPERTLARWLASRDLLPAVYAFRRVGPRPLRAAYAALIAELDVDAVVLVDGGTDIFMRGDDAGLGTPEEDMSSLSAVSGVEVAERLVVSLGFGIDAYHGVSHVDVLENLAALDRDGHYLGALSIPARSPEAAAYLDAVSYAQACTPGRPSIVNGQIAAALRGEFGDAPSGVGVGSAGPALFVNPLMAIYFAVDLVGLANSVGYLDRIANADVPAQVSSAIERYREEVERRPRRAIPH